MAANVYAYEPIPNHEEAIIKFKRRKPRIITNLKEESEEEKKEDENGIDIRYCLDIAFILDATGSMNPYINSCKENIISISSKIHETIDCDVRFALISYRDIPPEDKTFITKRYDFTPIPVMIQLELENISAAGGGDQPEALSSALYDCLYNLKWRDNSIKIIIVITDASPHGIEINLSDGFPDGDIDTFNYPIKDTEESEVKDGEFEHCLNVIDIIKSIRNELKAVIYGIGCEPSLSCNCDFGRDFMEYICLFTNGKFMPLSTATLLPDVIVASVKQQIHMKSLSNKVQETIKEIKKEHGENIEKSKLNKLIQEKFKNEGIKQKTISTGKLYRKERSKENINLLMNEQLIFSLKDFKQKSVLIPRMNITDFRHLNINGSNIKRPYPARPRGAMRNKRRKGRKRDWIRIYQFIIIASLFQIILLILFSVSSNYYDSAEKVVGDVSNNNNSKFIDVNKMMIVGFGFAMTYLRKYAFSAISFNFILCALSMQWGIYLFNMVPYVFGEDVGVLNLTADKLIDGSMSCCVVLITFGILLGRTNPGQLLALSFIELIFYSFNYYICINYLGIIDVGGSILIHTFSTYFGLTASWIIGLPDHDHENKSIYHSDIFSFIGTLFLWLYFPSFNAYFTNQNYYLMDRCIVNTVLSLCGSTTATFITSAIVSQGNKFKMVHIQNATLSGGIAIGATVTLYLHPSGAILIGLISGIISVCGYEYLSDLLRDKLGIYDTRGIHNLHGIPGILGGIISVIVIRTSYNDSLYGEYPFNYDLVTQSYYQIAGILVTLSMAIIGGLIGGSIICRLLLHPLHEYIDIDNYNVPGADKDYLRGTVRGQHFTENTSRGDFYHDALSDELSNSDSEQRVYCKAGDFDELGVDALMS